MLEHTRAEALNPKRVNEYFDLLGTTLDSLGLKNKPHHIYNCDKTFLPLDCNREKTVTCKGAKNTYFQSNIFFKYIVPERPVLLLTDGHKTHINIDVIDLCHDNGISLFCLPSHMTHA